MVDDVKCVRGLDELADRMQVDPVPDLAIEDAWAHIGGQQGFALRGESGRWFGFFDVVQALVDRLEAADG